MTDTQKQTQRPAQAKTQRPKRTWATERKTHSQRPERLTQTQTQTPTKAELDLWTQMGVLVALALSLGYADTLLPVCIPGVRLGLANIVVIVALMTLPLRAAAGITLLKALITGFFFGSPFAMAYSLLGTFLSFIAMAALVNTRRVYIVAISITGALWHTTGQLLVAQVLLGTSLVWAWTPLLCAASFATGTITGVLSQRTLDALSQTQIKITKEDTDFEAMACAIAQKDISLTGTFKTPRSQARTSVLSRINPLVKAICFLCLVVLTYQTNSPAAQSAALGLSACLAFIAHPRWRRVIHAGLPLCLIALATAAFQIAITRTGTVICSLGTFTLTDEGLRSGASILVHLICPLLLCASFAATTDARSLCDFLGKIVIPFEQRGIDTRGIRIASAVAFSYLPMLADQINDTRGRHRIDPALLCDLMTRSILSAEILASCLSERL